MQLPQFELSRRARPLRIQLRQGSFQAMQSDVGDLFMRRVQQVNEVCRDFPLQPFVEHQYGLQPPEVVGESLRPRAWEKIFCEWARRRMRVSAVVSGVCDDQLTRCVLKRTRWLHHHLATLPLPEDAERAASVEPFSAADVVVFTKRQWERESRRWLARRRAAFASQQQ